jgi:hypothetical protein
MSPKTFPTRRGELTFAPRFNQPMTSQMQCFQANIRLGIIFMNDQPGRMVIRPYEYAMDRTFTLSYLPFVIKIKPLTDT